MNGSCGVKRLEQRPVEGHAQAAGPVGALGRLGIEQNAIGDVGEAGHDRHILGRADRAAP